LAVPEFNDGSVDEVPWASVFDPDLNVRALGEIQARGFRAASELVDRFVRSANVNRKDEAREPSTEPPVNGTQRNRDTAGVDVGRVVGTWESLVGRLAGSLRATADSGPPTVDLNKANGSGSVTLAASPGERAHGEVWLHNGGATDMGLVRLRCSDLLGHDGSTVEALAVRIEPDAVAMPARCSRGVIVEVDVAQAISPGNYRGTLLAVDQPDVWLPVALTVRPPEA
jgi:hypothetical protein